MGYTPHALDPCSLQFKLDDNVEFVFNQLKIALSPLHNNNNVARPVYLFLFSVILKLYSSTY